MTKKEKQAIIQKVDEFYAKEKYIDAWNDMKYAIGQITTAMFDLRNNDDILIYLTSKQRELLNVEMPSLIEKLRDNIIEGKRDCCNNPEPTKEEFEIYFWNKVE